MNHIPTASIYATVVAPLMGNMCCSWFATATVRALVWHEAMLTRLPFIEKVLKVLRSTCGRGRSSAFRPAHVLHRFTTQSETAEVAHLMAVTAYRLQTGGV
jgi:hypothetical protein